MLKDAWFEVRPSTFVISRSCERSKLSLSAGLICSSGIGAGSEPRRKTGADTGCCRKNIAPDGRTDGSIYSPEEGVSRMTEKSKRLPNDEQLAFVPLKKVWTKDRAKSEARH